MSEPRTEYLRKIKFSCPVCLNSVMDNVWVHDPKDLTRLRLTCPVCGAATLRIDSPYDDIKFFAYLDMRRSINERIDEQMEETYDYL